ncbi:MAG: hypothetical protein EPO22_03390 [Dehalococcoidia bacterium]|nr:MAG: hypothetical protein EPO22_03390 [Dehalococcoidia bacterium]
MTQRFHFADAFWFRVPLRTIVVATAVFAILSLYPAVGHGTTQDQQRAIFGFTVLVAFVVTASVFAVAINDSDVTIEAGELQVHFEAFFRARIPLADVVAAHDIDPRPRWRYRFGLSTNFEDRVACSHGGPFVEIELARPCAVRLWPRTIMVRRFWLAVREHHELLAAFERELATRPQARFDAAA